MHFWYRADGFYSSCSLFTSRHRDETTKALAINLVCFMAIPGVVSDGASILRPSDDCLAATGSRCPPTGTAP